MKCRWFYVEQAFFIARSVQNNYTRIILEMRRQSSEGNVCRRIHRRRGNSYCLSTVVCVVNALPEMAGGNNVMKRGVQMWWLVKSARKPNIVVSFASFFFVFGAHHVDLAEIEPSPAYIKPSLPDRRKRLQNMFFLFPVISFVAFFFRCALIIRGLAWPIAGEKMWWVYKITTMSARKITRKKNDYRWAQTRTFTEN